jgi:Cupin domain
VESNNEFFKFEASASLPHRHSESSRGRSYRRSNKPTIDMVVRTHDYAIGSSTGWHTHPGPVFVTVTEGKVTFYEADDPNCTPKVISAGEGYVDSGNGHIGRNESGQPAKDVSVIIAPPGLPFRGELPAPRRYCAF